MRDDVVRGTDAVFVRGFSRWRGGGGVWELWNAIECDGMGWDGTDLRYVRSIWRG